MSHSQTYRVVASREGGFREVLAHGMTETGAKTMAKEMRELVGFDSLEENEPHENSTDG
jgi:hypothetical protein